MNSPLSFSRWTKRLRADLDLTQEMLAQEVGCSVETIRAFETGKRRPSRAMTERLADVLHVPADERSEFLRVARTQQEVSESTTARELSPLPPPAVINRLPSRLPTPSTLLIGRAQERADVCRRIADPFCRLLTIVGAGGIGKTRLALQVASDMADQFADGVTFVHLGHILAPEHVAAAIADAVGCSLSAAHTPEETLLTFLHNRHLLLVLDNFEHLLDSASLLAAILNEAPDVCAIVTSRERLHLQSEWIFELGGLATPRNDTRTEIERCDAVLLFLERARRISGDFALTPSNRAAVARICRLLDGMPLGIELTAHWIRMLTPDEIADELERSLELPSGGLHDLPQRHRSLRAVFDHSWRLLTETEQRVLCHLSIFQGGFSREAATSVADATLPTLVSLTDKSLLRRAQTGRYEMHPLVRWFASVHLNEHALWTKEAPQRHATFYARWLQQREATLKAAMSDGEVVAELRIEIENIWLAWDWMIKERRADLFLQGGGCFAFFLEMRCLFREGITLFERAASALADGNSSSISSLTAIDKTAYSHMLGFAGWLRYRSGDYVRGRELLEQSLAVLQSEQEDPALFVPIFGLGCVLLSSGEYERAHQLLTQSLHLARTARNDWQTAWTLTILGQLALSQADLHTAQDVLQQALAIWRVIGGGTSPCLNRLGVVLMELGEYDHAQALLQESIMISSNRGDSEDMAAAMVLLAKVASMQTKFDEAIYLFHESLAIFREVGTHSRAAKALVDLGWTYHAQPNVEAAYNTFVEALRTAYDSKFVPIAIDALYGLAALLMTNQSLDMVLELVLHVVQHRSTEQATRLRSQQLQADIERKMTQEQVDAVHITVQKQTFEAVVESVLQAASTRQLLNIGPK